MAKHNYLPSSNNMFEDDVNDDEFIGSYDKYRPRIPPPQSKPTSNSYGGHIAELERQKQVMLQKQREIEQRTLDSSARSIGLLRDSEQIGIDTAVELDRQREQLENTNKRLDEINTNLNYSQKHINGIKSVFYGLKNYISGKSDPPPSRVGASPSSSGAGPSSSKYEDNVDNLPQKSNANSFDTHPSARLRGLDAQSSAEPVANGQRVNDLLDANLEEMLQTISRLKGLGADLGNQIDSQNELIDTIQDKVEGADIKIGKQNKQMNKLLGK